MLERLLCVLIAILTMASAKAQGSSAVPPAVPSKADAIVGGATIGADKAGTAIQVGTDAGKVLGGTIDKPADKFIDKTGEGLESAKHLGEAYQLYRNGDAEGMLLYGIQEGGEKVLDNVVERFVGPAAPAWRLGRFAGNLLKENLPIGNESLESYVTGLYYQALEGRHVDREFELNTSDGAIELHRQRMRRAGIYSGVRSENERIAAKRAAAAAQASAAQDNAAFMNEMMLTIMPAAIAASQQRQIQPPLASPQEPRSPCPPGMFQDWSSGRCFSSPFDSSSVPAVPGGGRPSQTSTPPLGSTFGAHRDSSSDARRCTAPGCDGRNTELGPNCRELGNC